jgi:hypothetical protein
MAIQEKFPELMKFLGEMPVKISDTAGRETDVKNLYEYYGSLDAMVKGYATYRHVAKWKGYKN